MAADPLTDAVSARICKHMNDDHAEAVLAYAHHYGGVNAASAARMLTVTSTDMELEVERPDTAHPLRSHPDRQRRRPPHSGGHASRHACTRVLRGILTTASLGL